MQNVWKILVSNDLPDRGCSKCTNGNIQIPKKVGLGFKYATCDCEIERQSLVLSRRLLVQSNIDERFLRTNTLGKWEPHNFWNFDRLVKFIDSDSFEDNWFFIHGPAGTGKTFLAILLSQIAIAREKRVYFTNVTELLHNLRPSSSDATLSDRTMAACKTADLLILDDIGHEKSSQWVRERLYLIINSRWSSGKPTIFTSNFSIENLKATVSDAVYSRVKGNSIDLELTSSVDRRILKS